MGGHNQNTPNSASAECPGGSHPPWRRAQRANHLVVVGEPPGLVLGENQPAVGGHVKNALAAFHQLGIDAQPLFQLCRQTGGLGAVVSKSAIGNGDVHDVLAGVARMG